MILPATEVDADSIQVAFVEQLVLEPAMVAGASFP